MLGQFGLKGGIHPAGHKIADVSIVKDFQILKGDEFEANPNFWTDLKLYGLSSVFYRTQAI